MLRLSCRRREYNRSMAGRVAPMANVAGKRRKKGKIKAADQWRKADGSAPMISVPN